MFIKNVFLILFLYLILTATESAAYVHFKFRYFDKLGSGFNGPKNSAAKRDLEVMADRVGRWLEHDATVYIDVYSENSKGSKTLARGVEKQIVRNVNGEKVAQGVINQKIKTGEDSNGRDSDGEIIVNFNYNYAYGDSVEKDKVDFQGTMLHELTHLLGFVSKMGVVRTFRPRGKVPSLFDNFLVDARGDSLVRNLSKHSGLGKVKQVYYFDGPCVRKMCSGRSVPMAMGDAHHFDGKLPMHYDGVMIQMCTTGLRPREWNRYETAILKDLGYCIKNKHTKAS